MISVSVSVDVPNIEDGIRFYSEAFGFSKGAEPIPGVVVLVPTRPRSASWRRSRARFQPQVLRKRGTTSATGRRFTWISMSTT